jgi:hypothetical protein
VLSKQQRQQAWSGCERVVQAEASLHMHLGNGVSYILRECGATTGNRNECGQQQQWQRQQCSARSGAGSNGVYSIRHRGSVDQGLQAAPMAVLLGVMQSASFSGV